MTNAGKLKMAAFADDEIRGKDNPGAYLAAILAGGLASIVSVLALFMFLDADQRLPPPPIANNICIDEKLAFLRDHTFDSPTVLVLGSSIAWRNVDSAALSKVTGGLHTMNGAFCGLRMNQITFVGDWLLDRLSSVRAVILVASPFDFVGCSVNPSAVFSRNAADDFVFGQESKWSFYFRYFDPISMVRNAIYIRDMRSKPASLQPLVFTKFGDGPMDTDLSQPSLMYGALPELDRTCFTALRTLANRLASENRKLAVITTPLNPEWKKAFDRNGNSGRRLGQSIVEALRQTDAQYFDGDAKISMVREAFTDAIHLRWVAATTFSETFAQGLVSYLKPQHSEGSGRTGLKKEEGRAVSEKATVPLPLAKN
jgi:hypothetical protein